MRRGSRGYSADVKQAIIDKQDGMILTLLNSTHNEMSALEVAKALNLGKDLVKKKLNKLSAQGKIQRIKLNGIPSNQASIFYRRID